jgi:phosphonate transport system permease protein
MPARWKRPSIGTWLLLVVTLAFFISGVHSAEITITRLVQGVSNIGDFILSAFPPNPDRIGPIMEAIMETFEMALVGTIIGVILSVPVAILSSANTTPFRSVRVVTKTMVSAMRTIPDLIWALLFVISVGLGPLAGILTIAVDTIGFCARFFSERMEELDKGPKEALEAAGATHFGVISGAILPPAIPSMVGTSLYAVEKSIRSATILGLVGAGGIGVELSTSMSLRNFDEALMIILLILILVLAVEKVSSTIRAKFI